MAKDVSLLRTALCHKCPACGEGDIYEKILDVATRCSKCGQRLKEHDAGDGPVFFAMFISAIIITGLAFFVEVEFMVPLWLHFALWAPLTLALCIFLLRITKSFLIGLQYKHNVSNFKNQ